ncbi:hypothetical protein EJ02DRAFT_454725, partial [Clathrospora elynae]
MEDTISALQSFTLGKLPFSDTITAHQTEAQSLNATTSPDFSCCSGDTAREEEQNYLPIPPTTPIYGEPRSDSSERDEYMDKDEDEDKSEGEDEDGNNWETNDCEDNDEKSNSRIGFKPRREFINTKKVFSP